jgi:hypothetical protein
MKLNDDTMWSIPDGDLDLQPDEGSDDVLDSYPDG